MFQIYDYFSASGMVLLCMAFFETLVIGWVYGKNIILRPSCSFQIHLFHVNINQYSVITLFRKHIITCTMENLIQLLMNNI